jgi:hypothetical protein
LPPLKMNILGARPGTMPCVGSDPCMTCITNQALCPKAIKRQYMINIHLRECVYMVIYMCMYTYTYKHKSMYVHTDIFIYKFKQKYKHNTYPRGRSTGSRQYHQTAIHQSCNNDLIYIYIYIYICTYIYIHIHIEVYIYDSYLYLKLYAYIDTSHLLHYIHLDRTL